MNDRAALWRGTCHVGREFRTDMPRPVAKRPPDAKGIYANYFEVGHTAFEFVLEFGEVYAGTERVPCHTRIVTSPVYVLALVDLLRKSVADYESQFGRISEEKEKEKAK